MSKFRVVNIKELKTHFYVRKGINQDHVLMLAEIYEAAMLEGKDSVEASKAIEAIKVTPEGDVVDGRHRKEAMELAQLTDIRVELVDGTKADLFVLAIKANHGGSLPSTREDMIFNVEQMLGKMGMTQKAVEEALPILPKSVVRKYINTAVKRISEAKLRLALHDISSAGLTLHQAAKVHGLKVEAIQLALEGKKPKSKLGAAQLSATLTTYTKGYSNQISRVINKAIEDYQAGEIPEEAAQAAINHLGHLLRRIFLRTEDWNSRVKAIRTGSGYPTEDGLNNIPSRSKIGAPHEEA